MTTTVIFSLACAWLGIYITKTSIVRQRCQFFPFVMFESVLNASVQENQWKTSILSSSSWLFQWSVNMSVKRMASSVLFYVNVNSNISGTGSQEMKNPWFFGEMSFEMSFACLAKMNFIPKQSQDLKSQISVSLHLVQGGLYKVVSYKVVRIRAVPNLSFL